MTETEYSAIPVLNSWEGYLGKGAPLACSDLRTIFVSTKWKDELTNDLRSLVQGRATFMSFEKENKLYKSTGYWGNNYQPLTFEELPIKNKWLHRDELGTSVFIIGWNRIVSSQWVENIVGLAISNFFAAFLRKKLVLEIGKFTVNHENVVDLFNNNEIVNVMNKVKYEDFNDSKAYLRCLTDTSTVINDEIQLNKLGRTSLKICLADDAPRKIALIRQDMLITDSVPGLKQFRRSLKDFVAVIEVLDTDGSNIIRMMEPPKHNALSKDFMPTDEERKKATGILEELAKKVKNLIERHAGSEETGFGKVDFMAEFFEDKEDRMKNDATGEEVDPNGAFIFSPNKPKPITLKNNNRAILEDDFEDDMMNEINNPNDSDSNLSDDVDGSEYDSTLESDMDEGVDGGSGTGRGIESGSNSDGPNDGDGVGGTGKQGTKKKQRERDRPKIPFVLQDTRIVRLSDYECRIFATPSESAKVIIRLHEVGSDFDDPFEVKLAPSCKVVDGAIELTVKKNKRFSMDAEVTRKIIGGLKLVASIKGDAS